MTGHDIGIRRVSVRETGRGRWDDVHLKRLSASDSVRSGEAHREIEGANGGWNAINSAVRFDRQSGWQLPIRKSERNRIQPSHRNQRLAIILAVRGVGN